MTYERALASARELRNSLLDHGVRAVSIELMQGTGGSGWWVGTHVRKLSHHIVSSRSMGLTPGLNLVKVGRSDLTGPLCNGYGGFDEVYRIITMGWANHPGQGGPKTYDGITIPKDNGRPYLWGTEYEGGLNSADWTDSFHEFMARANAGVLDWLGTNWNGHDEHSGWAPDRKIDRLNYTTASGRAIIQRFWEEDVALSEADKTWIRNEFKTALQKIEDDIPRGVLLALTGQPNMEYSPNESEPFSTKLQPAVVREEVVEINQKVDALRALIESRLPAPPSV